MKFEVRSSKLKQGYTIVELVVVMGIIAVLMLLSATTFILLRDQAEVDQAAEAIVTTIRDAQNRAISITPNKDDLDAKVWIASINPEIISLNSLYVDDGKIGGSIESSEPNLKNITIEIKRDPSESQVNFAHISFAPPFAKTYLLADNLCNTSASVPAKGAAITDPDPAIGCTWWPSQKPTEEWEVKNAGTTLLATDEGFIIKVSRRNALATVIVKSNGDARIE